MAAACGSTSIAARSASSLNGMVTLAPSTPIVSREGEEVVEVSRQERHVDGIDAGGRERGVVHHRRQRMQRVVADHAEDRGAGADVAEPELVEHPCGRHLARRHALPAYVQRDPKRAASRRVGTPGSPMPMTTARPPARDLVAAAEASRRRTGHDRNLDEPAPSCASPGPGRQGRGNTGKVMRRHHDALGVRRGPANRTRRATRRPRTRRPASSACCKIVRRVSSLPWKRPPSQDARHVTTTGCRRPCSAPATSRSSTPSRRSSTMSPSRHRSRAARSSAIERPVTVSHNQWFHVAKTKTPLQPGAEEALWLSELGPGSSDAGGRPFSRSRVPPPIAGAIKAGVVAGDEGTDKSKHGSRKTPGQ